MPHELELAAATFLVCLGLTSLGAFLSWALYLRRRGGHVASGHFFRADLWVTLGLATIFVYLAASVLLAAPAKAPTQLKVSDMVLGTAFNVFIAGILAAFLAFRQGSVFRFVGLDRVPLARVPLYAAGFLVSAYPGIILLSLLVRNFNDKVEEQLPVTLFRNQVQSGHTGGIVIVFLAASICAPLVEEFAFRGYFYGSLKRFFGPVSGALITSALFALIHANLPSLPGLFFLALCLTVAYEWTGSLLVPICMHAIFNTVSLTYLLFEASKPA